MEKSSDGIRGWSNEVVEHLRGVHLLLFVTSAGLILITLSAKPYQPAKALTQLEEIQRLQKEWSPEFLYSQIIANRLPATPKGGVKNDWAAVPPVPPYSFHCRDEKTVYECVPNANWWAHFHDPFSPIAFPKTVAEFREFWDSLNSEEQWIDFVNQVGEGQVLGSTPIKIVVDPTVENVWSRHPGAPTASSVLAQKKLWLEKVGDNFEFRNAPEGVDFTWKIPVLTFRRCPIDQKGLTQIVRSWKAGSFDSSFKSLAEASDGLEELELVDLRKQLENEAGQGSELFEVAGVKIPSEQLTSAGIVAVIAIQFYFLILLRELFHKLHAADSGWEVPWIGMFGSPLAQFATWLGGAVCPITAAGLLAWHGFSQVHSATGRMVYFVAPILSLLLACASWMSRPTIIAAANEANEQQPKAALL